MAYARMGNDCDFYIFKSVSTNDFIVYSPQFPIGTTFKTAKEVLVQVEKEVSLGYKITPHTIDRLKTEVLESLI